MFKNGDKAVISNTDIPALDGRVVLVIGKALSSSAIYIVKDEQLGFVIDGEVWDAIAVTTQCLTKLMG